MEPQAAQNETPQAPHSVGRPTTVTAEKIDKLIEIFKLGVTNEIAIGYAEVKERTFYDHYKADEEFRSKIEGAKHFARIAASQAIVKDILGSPEKTIKLSKPNGDVQYKIIPEKEPNVETAKWWLEKHYKQDFGGIPVNQTNNQFNIEGSVSLENLTDEQLEQFIQSKNRQVRTSPVADGEAAPNSTQSTEIRETTPQTNTGEPVVQVNPGAILGEPGRQDGMGSTGNS